MRCVGLLASKNSQGVMLITPDALATHRPPPILWFVQGPIFLLEAFIFLRNIHVCPLVPGISIIDV